MSEICVLDSITDAYDRIAQSGKVNFARKDDTPSPEQTNTQTQTLSFADAIDLLNPLQHIPVIGTLYRAITGDEITPSVQVAGDIMYGALAGGGALTVIASTMNAAIGQDSGTPADIRLAQALMGTQDEPLALSAGAEPVEEKVASAAPSSFGGLIQDRSSPQDTAAFAAAPNVQRASSLWEDSSVPDQEQADGPLSLSQDMMLRALGQYENMAHIGQTKSLFMQ